jgi:hypothetical protein
VPLTVSIPPAPPLALTWGRLIELVRQVPARQPMEPPAAWPDDVAADAVGAAEAAAVAPPGEDEPADEPDDGVLAEPEDPPHAVSRAAVATAAAAQPAGRTGSAARFLPRRSR